MTKQATAASVDRGKFEPLDLLMWVGRSFYTVESFVKEARHTGVCKRIGWGFPKDIKVGQSRVFLAHDYTAFDKARHQIGDGHIFGYFTIRGILVVGDPKYLTQVEGVTIQAITPAEAASFPDRGCGELHVGAIYFVSEEDMMKLVKHAEGIEGHFTKLAEAIPIHRKRFRAYKYVLGDRVLARAPEHEWFDTKARHKHNRRLRPERTPLLGGERLKATYREVLEGLLAKHPHGVELEALIKEAIRQHRPFAGDPRRPYRHIIGKLVRLEFAEIVDEDGKDIVKPLQGDRYNA